MKQRDFLARVQSLKIETNEKWAGELWDWMNSLSQEDSKILQAELVRHSGLIGMTDEDFRSSREWPREKGEALSSYAVAVMKATQAGVPLQYPIFAQDISKELEEERRRLEICVKAAAKDSQASAEMAKKFVRAFETMLLEEESHGSQDEAD